MGDEWDAEDFVPEVVPSTLTLSNKWEGEDQDDDVKDSWEDEEEEKKDEEKTELTSAAPKPKAKKLAEKIAEKEKQQQLELEKKLAEEEAAMTPEERVAEKLRRQKMQEESDLKVAMETFGITEVASNLDSFNPTTKEEFDEYCAALSEKISSYRLSEEYPAFVSDLVKNVCLHLSSFDMKNLKSTLENLCLEKQKIEKGDKSKKPNKGKGKAKLNVESDISRMNQYSAYGDYDYDDFM